MWSFVYGIALVATASLGSSASLKTRSTPLATVLNGSYTGVYNPTYHQDFFLGVPYAQPPINDLRLRAPVPLNSTWSSPKEATAYPPFCAGYGADDIGFQVAEDCLYLEIVRPAGVSPDAKLPIAVWIHGGGLYQGGSKDPRYNLSHIVQNSVEMRVPMLAISLQYRLHAWGFLGGKEALEGNATNLGFRDQRLALHWIQENIAAFGGDPAKVTIWGESAGGQSVGAQLLAYNGRDDGLFRAAIAQSGGPSNLFFPFSKGYNSTAPQEVYNTVVSNTSCASTLASGDSLSCIRALPFAELNAALNVTTLWRRFPPQIDGDFLATYPSIQLANGAFNRVPLLIGSNTEEGTAFGTGYGPNGKGINTDAEFLSVLNTTFLIPPDSENAKIISSLYPNIQALGIPSLTTFPEVITPNSSVATTYGTQLRRMAAWFGDELVHAPRRATTLAWSKFNVPSYAYRFDVTVAGIRDVLGATHFQEVAFVFNNTQGSGYATNPFTNATEEVFELARHISRSWVAFITGLDPNGHGLGAKPIWPVYDAVKGGGAGKDLVFGEQGAYTEDDTWRGPGMAFIIENALGVFGR